MIVEISCEIEQLVFEIRSRPEQRAIEVFASNRAIMWPIQLCGVARVNAYFEGFSRFSAPHN
jgi:hypothetical protein